MLLLGDEIAYARALAAEGYLAADETTYARGIAGLKDEFARRLERLSAPEVPVPSRDDVRTLVAPLVEAREETS